MSLLINSHASQFKILTLPTALTCISITGLIKHVYLGSIFVESFDAENVNIEDTEEW